MPRRTIHLASVVDEVEERRRAAEFVVDVHDVVGDIVDEAEELIPGESISELREAFPDMETDFFNLAVALSSSNTTIWPYDLGGPKATPDELETTIADLSGVPPTPNPPNIGEIDINKLRQARLIGKVGNAKLAHWKRLKDAFYLFRNSKPRTDEKRSKWARAASVCLGFAGLVTGSIPGAEFVAESIGLVQHLIAARIERGV